ncbi:MAG TPA: nucleotidyltransferase domain-containing protein [Bryobacteraceae bacterium]|nr:nucleotidyltransferase domain-containing protein [Bryobacteraceae bacterium]
MLESHQAVLVELCRKFGVDRLDVFGSAARGDFEPGRSDVDLVVRFAQAGERGYADRYLQFAEAVEAALGCRIDLLTERSLRNPILIEQIAKDRLNLYAA